MIISVRIPFSSPYIFIGDKRNSGLTWERILPSKIDALVFLLFLLVHRLISSWLQAEFKYAKKQSPG